VIGAGFNPFDSLRWKTTIGPQRLRPGGFFFAHIRSDNHLRKIAELQQQAISLQAEIAERKRAEEELKQASRRKDEFLAMLAHELRNPLAPILSAVELLRRSGSADS